MMRFFPFGLPWRLARKLVGTLAYREHLCRLGTQALVIPVDHSLMYYIDGYGRRDA